SISHSDSLTRSEPMRGCPQVRPIVPPSHRMPKTTTQPRPRKAPAKGGNGHAHTPRASVDGKQLVIVESPSKAKTINKYLGSDFVVMASVGHVRDLPSKSPKGSKSPVPGVDLKHDFATTYEILPGKEKTINELKRAAKHASQIWFATDL